MPVTVQRPRVCAWCLDPSGTCRCALFGPELFKIADDPDEFLPDDRTDEERTGELGTHEPYPDNA